MRRVSKHLGDIEQLLRKYNHLPRAKGVQELRILLREDETRFWSRINSLDWWGGSGSMADLRLYDSARPDEEVTEDDRAFRSALVALYDAMVSSGHENERGEFWARTFKDWEKQGM